MDGPRKALIVANGAYEHDGLQHLRSPGADAAALAEVLADPAIGGFDVQVVSDEPSYVVQAEIEELFTSSRPEDLLLLHFSCHGLKSDSGELFFAVRNTRPDRLASSAVSADFVQRCIRRCRSRSVVLLLDCCYGGAYGRGVAVRASGEANVMDNFPQQQLGGGRGRAVITASSAIEYAFEGDRLADEKALRPSIFTEALVRGLKTGEADRDEDGLVSLNELYDYIFEQVRTKNANQTPGRDIEMAGELYLARSQRRRIKPAPMPPDLEAAVHDANMFSRIGAIAELRTRLLSDNLSAAVAAYEVLTEMACTDIAHVADLAQAACRDAQVQADSAEMHFGSVETGSPRPHRVIQLTGPPIARACLAEVTDDWLWVTVSESEVDLSISTGRLGSLCGSARLKGLTGEFVITVDAELVTATAPPNASVDDNPATRPPPATTSADVTAAPTPTNESPFDPGKSPESDTQRAEPIEIPVPSPKPRSPLIGSSSQRSRRPEGTHVGDVSPETTASKSTTKRGHPRVRSVLVVLWALIPVLSLGILGPVPIIHASIKLKNAGLALTGGVYVIAVIVCLATNQQNVLGLLAFVATGAAFLLRSRVFATSNEVASSDPPRKPRSRDS